MTAITYTYKVTRSDSELKVMEVEYSAEGYPTLLIGMPLPTEDVGFDAIIEAYSPVRRWLESTAVVVDVPIGTTGTITYEPAPAPVMTATDVQDPTDTTANQQMWSDVAFEQKIASTLVKFGVLDADPTAIPVATL